LKELPSKDHPTYDDIKDNNKALQKAHKRLCTERVRLVRDTL